MSYFDGIFVVSDVYQYLLREAWPTTSYSEAGPASVEYLVVAGGGGGGGSTGGGGGGGGLLASSFTYSSNTLYTVAVGAGGSAGPNQGAAGSGSNSYIRTPANSNVMVSIGGGGGAYTTSGGSAGNGLNGGSGGGGTYYAGRLGTPGTGTAGQGYDGGAGYNGSGSYAMGGGGGAAGVGQAATVSSNGNGGPGANTAISGANLAYGGGGGGGNSSFPGSGGIGGGGSGGETGVAGTVNTGGGGGGGWSYASGSGGAGGSGIVIIRHPNTWPTANIYTGANVADIGGYKIYTFRSSGSIIWNSTIDAPALVSGLVGWYDTSSVSGSSWNDKSGNGNHATISGATVTSVSTGNGANSITSVLTGTSTAHTVLWPSQILPATYTVFHVTRYTGGTNSRIYQGYSTNWLSGHWDNKSGQFYHNGWLSDSATSYHGTNWAVYTDQNSLGRSNGITRGTGGGGTSDRLCINTGTGISESSTWQTVECVVYNRTLTAAEYVSIERYLGAKYGINV